MNFQVVGERTNHRRGVYGAPAIRTDIQVLEEGSNTIVNKFYIQTAVTRGSSPPSQTGEGKGLHYAIEIRESYQGDRSEEHKILDRLYGSEDRNLLEQLSCFTEIHFNALREFRDGKIPKLDQRMIGEYFSSLDEKNLVTNPDACE